MGRPRIGSFLATVAVAVAVTGTSARADDWPQFRHDARRTAASTDRLQLPLTDIWTTPGFGLATWKGRAFYLGTLQDKEALVCADLRTGVVLWRRALSCPWRQTMLRGHRGNIVVSPDGVVFVEDATPGTQISGTVVSNNVRYTYGRSTAHQVLAFRATDGTPIARFPSPLDRNPVPRVLLYDGAGGQTMVPVEVGTQPLGPFLLQGNEISASSLFDQVWRWTPGAQARLLVLAHLFPRNLENALRTSGEPRPPQIVRALQHGWPTVAFGSGIVVGSGFGPDEETPERHTLALISGGGCLWHRDYAWGLGIPAVEQDMILTGAGGGNGTQAIMAHDGQTGAVRWTFAPRGLRPDNVGISSGMSAGVSSRGATLRTVIAPVASAFSRAHAINPGLVLSGGRVYGIVCDNVVALDTKTGLPLWSRPLGANEAVSTLVASSEHLLVAVHRRLAKETQDRIVALRLDSGKASWSLTLPRAGALALSDGLMFSMDSAIHCFAPAERTFHLAVDSDRREDYDRQPPPALAEEPPVPAPLPPGGEAGPIPAKDPTEPNAGSAPTGDPAGKPPLAVADASILRLHWGETPEELVRKVKARKGVLGGKPLLISLDWLDPTRTTIRGSQTGWNAKQIADFSQLCERLATEASPEHFDVAPEVNVYLGRDLGRMESVRALVRSAAAAVRRASPNTRVLVSFNREVMGGYGRGSHLPFGRVVMPRKSQQAELLAVFEDVDEVGLTSCPQAAFAVPTEIPGDYFLALKPLFGKRPLLITSLNANLDPASKTPEVEQASYLRHLVQCCYWLDAKLVAYPEVARAETAKAPTADPALRAGDKERLGLAMWRNTLTWKRVARLSAAAANLDTTGR
jgi:outer membrane protein assembly factor BamB